jgi:hypothetical protein
MAKINKGLINNGTSSIEVIAIGNKSSAIKIQYNNDKSQSLAEAASEIQKLLEQLEKSNPAATENEQITYVNIVSPNLKERWKAGLKDGTETAIDEFLLENKFLKVTKAFLMGWLQPK